MRRPLIIAILVIHFLGNTEMGQLFGFPQLISHYFQHSRQNPGLSFLAYLNMHYGGDDGTNADDHEDNKLPYHNHLQPHSFSQVIFSIPKPEIPVNNNDGNAKQFGGRFLTTTSSKHVLLVLQPPRLIC